MPIRRKTKSSITYDIFVNIAKKYNFTVDESKEEYDYKISSINEPVYKIKHKVICQNGHLTHKDYNTFNRYGGNCKICHNEKHSVTMERIISECNNVGFTLIDPHKVSSDLQNISAKRRMKFYVKCPNDHIIEKNLQGILKNGSYCKLCGRSDQELLEIQEKTKNTCIEKYGVDNPSKSDHIKKKIKSTWVNNYGTDNIMSLPEIKNKIKKTNLLRYGREWGRAKKDYKPWKWNIDSVREEFEKCGYTILSKSYERPHEKLKYICPNGHNGSIQWMNFVQGHRCKQCANEKIIVRSKGEIAVAKFIEQNYTGIIKTNDKTAIYPLEIDVYLPNEKLGFEYHGIYYHSSKFKHKNYHLDKFNACQEKGITLIQIFEDEWRDKQEIVKSRILNLLGKSKRIYARNCDFREIDKKTANHFCNQNHLQGSGNTKKAFGLYHDNDLVSVMTFSKPSISKGSAKYDWEMNRFCSKIGFSVIGGASKLFKNSGIKNVISYCDIRWSNGSVYRNIGFVEHHISKPNYWYIEEENRVHRFRYRKDRLYSLIGDESIEYESVTELQLAEMIGLERVYDAGNIAFEYKYHYE